ncbi:hypothetical protein [Sabulibacter ruber]|uniref:hypothetical protein n=1 Tax=Sabulibacter ruber TaxID=2811901 RepID=UPI001A95A5BE|nr:hypothetical protein [Sabulibacter ruber]
MGLFYKSTDKELLTIRNKIVTESAIPSLEKLGFKKSPFSTAWYGRNEHGDFNYELCRFIDGELQIVDLYVARGDRYIKVHLNIFNLTPELDSIDQLNGLDGAQFHIPPNSISNMHWRLDDIKGIPLFSLNYMSGHKLGGYWTKSGLTKAKEKLRKTIIHDIANFEYFHKCWHAEYFPLTTTWEGMKIELTKSTTANNL